ncbi:MAG: S-adenosyl-l-methionine hydroxide adenosyltransferase family protein [Acidobacteriota bacterium]
MPLLDPPLLTLLTDFGTADYYVAAVKGVVLSLAPRARIVDLGHDIAPGDVLAASFLLAAVAPLYPPGTVHLAVVDPGVGSARRILLVERDRSLYLAPDNGLLTPLLTAAETRSVERPDLHREAPGQTFHGRDRFAPIAAALLGGALPASLGPVITDPVRIERPAPHHQGREIHGHVVHVDRFGNLVTDIPASWLDSGVYRVGVAGHETGLAVGHYAELPPDAAGYLAGSLGTVELALCGASLALAWDVHRGAAVRIERMVLSD